MPTFIKIRPNQLRTIHHDTLNNFKIYSRLIGSQDQPIQTNETHELAGQNRGAW